MGDATPEERPAAQGKAGPGEEDELPTKNEEKMTDVEQERNGENSPEQKNDGDDAGDEEEEPGECGFCLFMKSGPCRDSFISWEQCVEQAEKDKEDMVEKCHKVTFMLKECMEHNSDYYQPVLQAEKAALEEQEEAAAASQDSVNPSPPDSQVHSQPENRPSLDAPQSQVPARVDIEEHRIHTNEQHTHDASLDAPAGTHNPPDSHAATQERSSA